MCQNKKKKVKTRSATLSRALLNYNTSTLGLLMSAQCLVIVLNIVQLECH